MTKAKFNQNTRNFYEALIKDKPLKTKIKYLEIAERQKYHYYIDCNCLTPEYQTEWNELITMIDELKNSND